MKTGTDSAPPSNSPRTTTVQALSAVSPPASPSTRTSVETAIWQVTVYVTSYKEEADKDLHLAVRDAAGHTMIVEIPAASCVGAGSPYGYQIQAVRRQWLAQHPVSTSYTTLSPPVKVTVTGPGFFDRLHGQRGVAPNGVELHPVLSMKGTP